MRYTNLHIDIDIDKQTIEEKFHHVDFKHTCCAHQVEDWSNRVFDERLFDALDKN